MDEYIAGIVAAIATALVVSVIADRRQLGIRLGVLERMFNTQEKVMDSLQINQKDHDNRITSIESVIPELRNLIDALKDVPKLLVRVETLMETNAERIERVEKHVFRGHANI